MEEKDEDSGGMHEDPNHQKTKVTEEKDEDSGELAPNAKNGDG